MSVNLLKTLLKNNIGSKEEVLNLIKSGLVKVDNTVVTDPGMIIDRERIVVNGKKLIEEVDMVYYMLNKPIGYLTSSKDSLNRKTIYELIKGVKETVGPIGRLDYDSSGLIILTNDLEFKRRMEDPKTNIEKEYRVKVEGLLRKDESSSLRKGIELKEYKTTPLKISDVLYNDEKTATTLNVTIKGGRNRDIERAFEAVNHKIKSIKRIRIEELNLDIDNGCYRALKPHEVKLLKLKSLGIIKK